MKYYTTYILCIMALTVSHSQTSIDDTDDKNTGFTAILQFGMAKNYEAQQIINIPNGGSRGIDLNIQWGCAYPWG